MKKLSIFLLFATFVFITNAQETPTKATKIEKKQVEIACGECMFKMDGKGCDLAVKIDGKPYFVDGRGINDFGDAHADDGFCNAIRKATVTGEIVEGRFKAKSIQLADTKKTKKPKSK
ncbi:MAG: DUF6370 family protein [Pedobacter sp.]|uniref:DUF6370 family protein n=1 Tax=Pedobacter sp. TaxID=1411316 RepID=UPI00280823B1|nr:DUF6370 family protein [Pedobacter sp.]MDQ8006209.1 DUF6370 family protein [Pedobacter sp.]